MQKNDSYLRQNLSLLRNRTFGYGQDHGRPQYLAANRRDLLSPCRDWRTHLLPQCEYFLTNPAIRRERGLP